MVTEQIEALLREKFTEPEFAALFLIELKLGKGNKLEVFLDSDTGISFDTCRSISRYLEQHLDEQGWLGESYTLEVSSPGVSRPLQLPRQYPKHLGRILQVTTQDGLLQKGKLLSSDDAGITLEVTTEIPDPQGKKKKIKQTLPVHLPFAQIKSAMVEITF